MYNLHIETKRLNGQHTLSWNLAHHLVTRCMEGRVAIITERPASLMASVKRQWLRQFGDIQDGYRIDLMKSLSFSASSPYNEPTANVLFSTPNELKVIPPICRTLYVTCDVSRQDMYMITSWMPPHSLVVTYK